MVQRRKMLSFWLSNNYAIIAIIFNEMQKLFLPQCMVLSEPRRDEVDVVTGMWQFTIVWLGDTAIKKVANVRSAIKTLDISFLEEPDNRQPRSADLKKNDRYMISLLLLASSGKR